MQPLHFGFWTISLIDRHGFILNSNQSHHKGVPKRPVLFSMMERNSWMYTCGWLTCHSGKALHQNAIQWVVLLNIYYLYIFAISDSMQLFCLHARLGMHEWFIKPKCHAPWPCFPFVYQFTTLDNAATTSRRDFSRSVKCDEYVFTMHVKNTRARCMRMRFYYILHISVHPRPFGTCSSLWRMVVSCLHLSHCPLPSSSRKFWSPHTEAPTLVIFMALLMRMACNGSKVALPNQYCKLLICV